jgi:dTDP-4-dehydrorhamnose reductase
MMKRIYIAGCGGMLGEGFYKQFKEAFTLKCTDKDVNSDWLSFLDFRDFDSYRQDVKNFAPDFLFHLGAYTDLEYCEKNIDDTYMTNTLSVEHACQIANELDIPLLYISTAGIFDGEKDLYDDWDVPNPLGHYARSKYMGELYVQQNVRKHYICRAGWMMGGGPEKDKKFVHKIMKQLKEGKKELFVVNDKDGTPTYTHDFANTVKELIQTSHYGLYNLVCDGLTGRFDVAKCLLEILGKSKEVKLVSVSSEYFSEEYFAHRPASERLINKKLNLRGLNKMQPWEDALRNYLRDYYADYLSESVT